MRLALTELWAILADRASDFDAREGAASAHGPALAATRQDLAVAEQALTAFSHRISAAIERHPADQVPFLAEPNLPAPEWVSADLGAEVLLLRVSQALEQFARLLESLRIEDLDRRWRSEAGISTLGDLVEKAIARTGAHLKAAVLSARLATHD